MCAHVKNHFWNLSTFFTPMLGKYLKILSGPHGSGKYSCLLRSLTFMALDALMWFGVSTIQDSHRLLFIMFNNSFRCPLLPPFTSWVSITSDCLLQESNAYDSVFFQIMTYRLQKTPRWVLQQEKPKSIRKMTKVFIVHLNKLVVKHT